MIKMTDVQQQILELRKELRADYERLCRKYYDIFLKIDTYFENLSNGLEQKELKGGKE